MLSSKIDSVHTAADNTPNAKTKTNNTSHVDKKNSGGHNRNTMINDDLSRNESQAMIELLANAGLLDDLPTDDRTMLQHYYTDLSLPVQQRRLSEIQTRHMSDLLVRRMSMTNPGVGGTSNPADNGGSFSTMNSVSAPVPFQGGTTQNISSMNGSQDLMWMQQQQQQQDRMNVLFAGLGNGALNGLLSGRPSLGLGSQQQGGGERNTSKTNSNENETTENNGKEEIGLGSNGTLNNNSRQNNNFSESDLLLQLQQQEHQLNMLLGRNMPSAPQQPNGVVGSGTGATASPSVGMGFGNLDEQYLALEHQRQLRRLSIMSAANALGVNSLSSGPASSRNGSLSHLFSGATASIRRDSFDHLLAGTSGGGESEDRRPSLAGLLPGENLPGSRRGSLALLGETAALASGAGTGVATNSVRRGSLSMLSDAALAAANVGGSSAGSPSPRGVNPPSRRGSLALLGEAAASLPFGRRASLAQLFGFDIGAVRRGSLAAMLPPIDPNDMDQLFEDGASGARLGGMPGHSSDLGTLQMQLQQLQRMHGVSPNGNNVDDLLNIQMQNQILRRLSMSSIGNNSNAAGNSMPEQTESINPTKQPPSQSPTESRDLEKNASHEKKDTSTSDGLPSAPSNNTSSSEKENVKNNTPQQEEQKLPQLPSPNCDKIIKKYGSTAVLLQAFKQTMRKSQLSQRSIQSWDKKMGLKRSHSATMTKTTQSRNQLRELFGMQMKAFDRNFGTPEAQKAKCRLKVGNGKNKRKKKTSQDEDKNKECNSPEPDNDDSKKSKMQGEPNSQIPFGKEHNISKIVDSNDKGMEDDLRPEDKRIDEKECQNDSLTNEKNPRTSNEEDKKTITCKTLEKVKLETSGE